MKVLSGALESPRCLVPACAAYANVHAGQSHESEQFEHPKWRITVQKHDTELRWTVQASLTDTNVLSTAEAIGLANDMHYAAAEAARLNKQHPGGPMTVSIYIPPTLGDVARQALTDTLSSTTEEEA